MQHSAQYGRSSKLSAKKQKKHLFIVYGEKAHHIPTPPWLIAMVCICVTGLMAWYLAATAYIIFRDDVLAAAVSRQTRMQHNYEDRIAALRLQVDKITSRQLLDQEAFVAKLEKVMDRQQIIEQRAIGVNALLEQTRIPTANHQIEMPQEIVTGSLSGESFKSNGVHSNELRDGKTTTNQARAVLQKGSIPQQIAQFEGALHGLDRKQNDIVTKIEANSAATERRIRLVLNELGVKPKIKFSENNITIQPNTSAQGGPFIPASNISDDFFKKVERAKTSLNTVRQLEKSLVSLPLRRPIFGSFEITSTFGSRSDPFLGAAAYHAGLDVRGPTGQPIYSTAGGIVSSAGNNGGYGNMVEIDHGDGLTTRYGHMSEISVKDGQQIAPGTLIGRVGSTGRSTGPHLHYETRIDDEAVDPMKFIKAGMRLGKF